MESSKSKNNFDDAHKAIVCYNLACSYQLVGELNLCSKYLNKAITFVKNKVEGIRQEALRQTSLFEDNSTPEIVTETFQFSTTDPHSRNSTKKLTSTKTN